MPAKNRPVPVIRGGIKSGMPGEMPGEVNRLPLLMRGLRAAFELERKIPLEKRKGRQDRKLDERVLCQ